jgi:hypothetical protein
LTCVAHINGKGCSNASAVRGDSLEARVLVGLKDQMMAPDMMADAMRAFIEETNHLNQQRRANEGADRQRLERARKAIASIVSAIEDGRSAGTGFGPGAARHPRRSPQRGRQLSSQGRGPHSGAQ